MSVVIALGGNALMRAGDSGDLAGVEAAPEE